MDASQQAQQAVNDLASPYNVPKEQRAEARAKYDTAQREIRATFAQDLADQYLAGDYNKAQQDAIFQQAWEDGHHAGFHEVEGHYQTLADFLEKLNSLAGK